MPPAIAADGGPIQVGQPLPEVRIAGEREGELQLEGNDIRYVPWSPSALRGKPRIVYHIAARPGVDKIHTKLFERITELDIDTDRYVTLTLLNGDDVTLGVTRIARGELEKNKKKYPEGNFVFDGSSAAQQAWALQRKSSAVILVDESGMVLFFKDGALTDAEREQLLEQVIAVSGHPP